MLHVFLVWPLKPKTSYKKMFFKILNGFYLIWPLSSKKSSTTSYKSSKKFLQNSPQRVSKEADFKNVQKYWVYQEGKNSLETSWRKSSTHFWNQCKFRFFWYSLCPVLKKFFFNSYKGQCYFLEVKRSKKIKTLQYLKKRFFINLS